MNETPKSNSVVTSRVREDGVLEVTVLKAGPDGSNAVLTLDPAAVHENNRRQAMYMGFTSRIVDAAALPFNKEANRYATPAEKLEAMRPIVEHLASGAAEWKIPRAARVAKPAPLDPLILAAVAGATGKDVEAVLAMVRAGAAKREIPEPAYLQALSISDRVAPILKRMRDEAAAKIAGGADLLDEMMAEAEGGGEGE